MHWTLDTLNVDVDVVLHKTVNLNVYLTVNFSLLLSSPPLWIVAIHDLLSVSSAYSSLIMWNVLCVVLNLKWMTLQDDGILFSDSFDT